MLSCSIFLVRDTYGKFLHNYELAVMLVKTLESKSNLYWVRVSEL
jgi:hypothetical protein